jgi:8-oxo-dGTP pyrophosphatase MutT (NUDIX family)
MPNASATLPSPFSEAGFRAAAGRGLRPILAPSPAIAAWGGASGPSDFDLNPAAVAELETHPEPRPAAVLVPVVARQTLSVLLTQRTDSLPSHAGQISFPGGKIEPGDADPVATALREAQEEIGLDAAFVEPLGYLDPYRTGTGFRIFPVVALVRAGFELLLDRREVAEAFEVPLEFLMDERNHQTHVRSWRGAERRFYAMPFQERYIWGATAGIMKNMHQRLFCA